MTLVLREATLYNVLVSRDGFMSTVKYTLAMQLSSALMYIFVYFLICAVERMNAITFLSYARWQGV